MDNGTIEPNAFCAALLSVTGILLQQGIALDRQRIQLLALLGRCQGIPLDRRPRRPVPCRC
jgi:hypothetical protein